MATDFFFFSCTQTDTTTKVEDYMTKHEIQARQETEARRSLLDYEKIQKSQ